MAMIRNLLSFKRIIQYALIIVLLSAVWQVWRWLTHSPMLTIAHVNVILHDDHIVQTDVKTALGELVQGNLFTLKTEPIVDRLMSLPWVAGVNISRVWPNTVKITLSAQHAIASWQDQSLLNEQGRVFTPLRETWPDGLVALAGPDGSNHAVLKAYETFQAKLAVLSLHISRLQLNNRHAWQITLDDGTQLFLGREKIASRLQRFITLYPTIVENSRAKPKRFDMRYPRGIAVSS